MAEAALTFVVTHNSRSTISLIIVAGACGVAAGTPLAILGGIGRTAHGGTIIKGGLYLERLAEVDTILLDRTGTLTYGTPDVEEVRPAPGIRHEALLRAAAVAEGRLSIHGPRLFSGRRLKSTSSPRIPRNSNTFPAEALPLDSRARKSSSAAGLFWRDAASWWNHSKSEPQVLISTWRAGADIWEAWPYRNGFAPKPARR